MMADFYKNTAEIETLVEGFRNLSLPAEKWTHEAHLTTGLWFLKNYDLWEATCFLRSGIITYNHSVGGKNTPQGGYHETMTLFWINILAQFVRDNPKLDLLAMCNAFLASDFASKELPFRFYSKVTLFSTQARASWVEPDLIDASSLNHQPSIINHQSMVASSPSAGISIFSNPRSPR